MRQSCNFDFFELVFPKNAGNKEIIIFQALLMTEIEMVSIVVKRPWPTGVNGAQDKANFDLIELVHPTQTRGNKKKEFSF